MPSPSSPRCMSSHCVWEARVMSDMHMGNDAREHLRAACRLRLCSTCARTLLNRWHAILGTAISTRPPTLCEAVFTGIQVGPAVLVHSRGANAVARSLLILVSLSAPLAGAARHRGGGWRAPRERRPSTRILRAARSMRISLPRLGGRSYRSVQDPAGTPCCGWVDPVRSYT